MRVLTAAEMAAVDRRAIEEIGIPGLVLMENAALGVVEALLERFPDAERPVIVCGPGNNGGDGLAVARHLEARGLRCRVVLLHAGRAPGGDAALQLEILRRSGIAVDELGAEATPDDLLALCRGADLVVDALFGTGLGRPLEGIFAAAVRALDELPLSRLAVDLPSGLDGSRGETLEPHLRADLTVTFGAPKVAHVLPPASDRCGELVVADLGIPRFLLEEAPGGLHLLLGEELAALLPPRERGAHKGSYGHLLLVAGSPGKAGAAILALRAAVRAGSGLVTAAVPEAIAPILHGGSFESMTVALASDGGFLGEAALAAVAAAAAGKDALAVGPGIGTGGPTQAFVRSLLATSSLPAVVDADGLAPFVARLGDLRRRPAPTVLTPHPGEMGRLLGLSTAEVEADRLAAVRRAVEESGAVVVLKGRRTLVADPAGEVFVNPTGNPGMASGGSGDVLTGLLGGLLARGLEAIEAATLAVYLHGLAGDLAAERQGEEALIAGDLVDALPAAFKRLTGA